MAARAADSVEEDDAAAVCAFWKKFDLDGRRHKLDQQALEMRARHDATVSGRRALTEATKTFFKNSKAERASGLRALLKRYQEEVDTLTRRARSSDKAFRDLFRALIDAPDPAAALQSAADSERRVAEASEEAERLRSEVAEYEAEFSTLKNQDITIRQLEERLRGFEDDVEQQVADLIAERERELRASLDAELEAARAREEGREKAVASAQQEAAAANRLADETQTQLMELRTRYDEDTAAYKAEIDVLAQESDRANARVLSLTKELQMARAGEEGKRNAESSELNSHVETTKRLIAAEADAARQRSAMKELTRQWEATVREQQKQHDAALARAMEELEARKSQVAELQAELDARTPEAEVASLRKRLKALEAVHFNVEADGDDDDYDGESTEASAALRRVRHLDSEVVRLRREGEELSGVNKELEAQVKALSGQVDERDTLIARLESQLTANTSAPSKPALGSVWRPTGSSHTAATLASVLDGSGSGTGASDADGSMHDVELGGGGDAPVGEGAAAQASAAAGPATLSVVDILRGQRDRFRGKVLELEKQCQQLRGELSTARNRSSKLTQDNVKLFEKVRYLQSYARTGDSGGPSHAAGSGAGGGGGQLAMVETGGTGSSARRRHDALDDFEAPYSRIYEESVNPFTVFNRKEKQKRYSNLSTAEKITLSSSRFFLSNKYARNFVFFYSLALHLLVFSTLFHFTHVNHKACRQ